MNAKTGTVVESRYDDLYDRLVAPLKTRAGTRYERLAAIVLQLLHSEQVVVHDVRLRGSSTVKHQIDVVVVEEQGKKRRVLIECKDFDVTGKPVGLGIVRDFRSVVEDVSPDDAFILACTGFTRGARKFAKAKGIRLAVMRVFEDVDWEGRIKTIILNMHVLVPPCIEAMDIALDPSEHALFAQQTATGSSGGSVADNLMEIESVAERLPLKDFATREAEALASGSAGLYRVVADPAVWRIAVVGRPSLAFTHLALNVRTYDVEIHTSRIESNRIAELIVQGFGADEVLIFSDQIEAFSIDQNGIVSARPQGANYSCEPPRASAPRPDGHGAERPDRWVSR